MTDRIHQVSLRGIDAHDYAITLTEREYQATRSLAYSTGKPVARLVRESIATIRVLSDGAPVADLAARACLPVAAWLRLVLLTRVGVSDLGEQLACVGHS